MANPRLHEVVIKHRVMVHAENPDHAAKIVRLHLRDSEAEWPLVSEIGDCASVEGLATICTDPQNICEGYRDVAPWSDSGETRTCGEILKDEADELDKQRHEKK